MSGKQKSMTFKTLSAYNQMYHNVILASAGVVGNKLFICGGGIFGGMSGTLSMFLLDAKKFVMTKVTGTPPMPFTAAASCMIDGKMIVVGGAEYQRSLSRMFTIQTKADPCAAMTQATLKEGCFFTNGRTLAMVLPPLLPPNVIQSGNYMARVFNLTDGSFMHDVDCGVAAPGHSTVYDAHNNVIWALDFKKHYLRRWQNTGPSPLLLNEIVAMKDGAAAASTPSSDVNALLLSHIDRFARINEPTGAYDPRMYSLLTLTRPHQLMNEPFCVEISRDTFVMLYSLLRDALAPLLSASTAASAGSESSLASAVIFLRLLALNLSRLIVSRNFSLSEITHSEIQRISQSMASSAGADAKAAEAKSDKNLGQLIFELLTQVVVALKTPSASSKHYCSQPSLLRSSFRRG
jgi:hypothetical protein